MPQLTKETLAEYRAQTYRLQSPLTGREQAVAFVKERGFIHFWPIKGVELPSLWTAVAGDRPVADTHGDPAHITWEWKDALLGERVWYYAKVLRKKATLIDLDVVPYFYALSENYGSPDEDYLIQYHEGKLTQEAKAVYEALLYEGPLDTIALRKATRMTSVDSKSRFERALVALQADFKILPTGISQAGAWRYAFIYDLVHRHYPELPQRAHPIRQKQAREKLLELYFYSVGAGQIRDLNLLFGWRSSDLERAVQILVDQGIISREIELKEESGEWLALKTLF
jgi:hypothetical protein